jgi:uncharacterized protein with PIN domain
VSVLVDTSVLIDYLRGHPAAATLLERERDIDVLHASEVTRLEILAGMRPAEEDATRSLLPPSEPTPGCSRATFGTSPCSSASKRHTDQAFCGRCGIRTHDLCRVKAAL